MSEVRVLAISGSLRACSSNTELLKAAALLAPPSMHIGLHTGLARLPHFNPDLDAEDAIPPAEVAALRAQVANADALLISSPEYAHGVPGALKNALDWLVSGPEIIHKPIGLFNASPRASHAYASLAETLRTMSTEIVPDASLTFPLAGSRLDATGIAADAELQAMLRAALRALEAAARVYRTRR